MSRSLTSALLTEILSSRLRPVIFVRAEFTSGPIFMWSGVGQIVWNGQTWTGSGQFGKISAIGEASDIRALGIELELSGVPTNLIQAALEEVRITGGCDVWFGAMSETGQVIADPHLIFSGKLDVPTIEESGETFSIRIRVESELIRLKQSSNRRYNHADQQIDFPGDRGFEYVEKIQEMNLTWGGKGVPTTSSGSAGIGGTIRRQLSS